MRILMAGVSGFLGTRLVDRLTTDGHQVTRLVRRAPRTPDERQWNPSAAQLDPQVVADADAVVNLAGAGVGDKRWNDAYKGLIRSSRVDSTTTLAITIAGLPAADRPAVLVNASAVGWYGNTGDRTVEEDAPAGEGFLADVCRVWEAATRPAEDAGTRVVRLRTGLPLHRDGGMLKPQLLPFRLGVGGKLGNGRQWLPWISLYDWLDAVAFLLARDDLAGPVNVVGPAPVTNAEFTRELARQLHRPAIMPIPALALKVALGGFAHEALTSTRVLPGVLGKAGFAWTHPDLPGALRAALAG
ncbi:TIGR01777 family protein [Micromonospora terminaliae]|uniref:TIGR01777 family protein n=1 Tax=Micromonospora terminaliae TaxID=1914461 RepID=A0AAJ2ZGG3_9ACTN|nr:TIGR01777 family oxidoreductase [Micromonospora terminaliae]NES29637.1 TIGR01777 family protein [Micromonospora terminaliae]QGL48636.1 TIGR01777 family protein [Micromonospora terminaliae]